jgi:hypothetical protein
MAILLKVGEVAEDKDLRQAGRIEECIDQDAAAVVEWRAEELAQGRGLDTGCPERNHGVHALAGGLDPAGTEVGDLGLGVDFDAEAGEGGFGFGGEVGRVGGQDAR